MPFSAPPQTGLILLASQTLSGQGAADFTGVIAPMFDEFQLHIINLVPSVSDAALNLLGSSDGGATWLTTNYYGGDGVNRANWPIVYQVNASAGTSGVVHLFNLAGSAGVKRVRPEMLATSSIDGSYVTGAQPSSRIAATAINGLRLLPSSGVLSSGLVSLFGVKLK